MTKVEPRQTASELAYSKTTFTRLMMNDVISVGPSKRWLEYLNYPCRCELFFRLWGHSLGCTLDWQGGSGLQYLNSFSMTILMLVSTFLSIFTFVPSRPIFQSTILLLPPYFTKPSNHPTTLSISLMWWGDSSQQIKHFLHCNGIWHWGWWHLLPTAP